MEDGVFEEVLYWYVALQGLRGLAQIFTSYEIEICQPMQRLGIGKVLLDDLETFARKWGMKKVMLTVLNGAFVQTKFRPGFEDADNAAANVDAVRLYERLG